MAKQVVKTKKGGVFGKIILFILAFILGAVASLGGVAGIAYYVSKKKTIKELFGYAGLDYSAYLTEEYASKTVLDAIGYTVQELSKLADGSITLNDLDAITPLASTKAIALADTLYNTYGIQINEDGALFDVPLSQAEDHINACVKKTPVPNLLSAFGEGNKVIDAICYGTEGEDYIINEQGEPQMLNGKQPLTVGEFAGSGLDERLDALPFVTLVDIDINDEVMRSIAYGPAHRYEIVTEGEETKVVMNTLFYTFDGTAFLDDNGTPLDCTYELLSNGDYLLCFADETKQYVSQNADGNYDVFKATKAGEKGDQLKFKATTLGDLQDDSKELVNAISLKDALNVTPNSHSVLIALACGQEGIDFNYTYDDLGNKTGIEMLSKGNTIGDLRANSTELIDNIYLDALIKMDTDDAMIMYLHYGKKDVHYQVNSDDSVTALQKKVVVIDGKICNEYGEELPDVSIENLSETTGKFTQVINGEPHTFFIDKNNFVENEKHELYLHKHTYEFYHLYDENGNALYYQQSKLKNITTNNSAFANLTGRLSLDDIIEIEDNIILKHLHDIVIDDLTEAIDDLTVGQVFEKDIYYTNAEGQFTLPDGTVVPADEKVLRPMWKYMLTPSGEDEPNFDYKLTSELNSMIDNMQNNVRTKSVSDLVADGIITPNNTSAFTKIIPNTPEYGEYAGKCIGDFNIEELVQFLSVMTIGWDTVS